MNSKENQSMALRTNVRRVASLSVLFLIFFPIKAVTIKPEPQEFTMPNPLVSSINTYPASVVSNGVKPEPGTADDVARVVCAPFYIVPSSVSLTRCVRMKVPPTRSPCPFLRPRKRVFDHRHPQSRARDAARRAIGLFFLATRGSEAGDAVFCLQFSE